MPKLSACRNSCKNVSIYVFPDKNQRPALRISSMQITKQAVANFSLISGNES